MNEVSNKIIEIDKSNWQPVTFGDVVFEPKESTKVPIGDNIKHVVGLEHITSEDIHLRNSASIEESTTFTKKFAKDDVLFGRRRAYLKKAARAKFGGICSGDITVFRAKESLMPELLPFVVHNEKFFDYAVKHSAGGLSPRVKFKDLANYEFLLPPKDQQIQLAKLLWAMDETLEKEYDVLACFNIFKKSKQKKLLIPEITKKWESIKIKQGFEKITTKNKESLSDNVLTISSKHGLINQEEYFNRQVASKNLSNYYVIEFGDFAYNKSYSDGYPAGAIKVLDKYNNYYEYLFDFGYLNKQILSIAKEGARNHGLLNVAGSDFFNLKIPKPTYEYLERIIPILRRLDLVQVNIESQISNSRALQKSLINQVF